MMGNTETERDERIDNEVIVDAYGPEEQALGWYYYLERSMHFPVLSLTHKFTKSQTDVSDAVEPNLQSEDRGEE